MTPEGVLARGARPLRARLAGAAGIACGLALAAAVAHAESSPYTIGASVSYTRQANLLQLADGQPPPANFTRRDAVLSTALQAGIDQPFGRQRAYANLSLRDSHYARNTIYDNLGYAASAGLDWETAGRISGSVSASSSRSLYAFNVATGVELITQRNLQDTNAISASLNVGLVTRFSILFSIGHLEVRNSLDKPSVQALNYTQDSPTIGLRWRPAGATVLGVTIGETRGHYPKFSIDTATQEYTADRFKQPNIDLSAIVQPSGASSLEAHLGYSRTRYDLNQPRDFSGVTGHLSWDWQPGGLLRLNTQLSRDTGQSTYAVTVFGLVPGTSDYSQVLETLRVQADYALSGKVALTSALQVTQRTVVNTVDNPLFPLSAQGEDRTTSLSLGAQWTPLRSLTVGCNISTVERTARGVLTAPLHDHVFGCNAQLQLQR